MRALLTPRLLCVALAATLLAAPAFAFDLVSKSEAMSDAAAPEVFAKGLPVLGAPNIDLVSPDVKKPLTGAVNIVVRWAATDGATIDLSTFKVLYGRLRIDVTQRLAGHAKVTATGLEAQNASLPEGSHRLMIQIADNQKRLAQHEVLLEVAAKP
ncbi:MAG: hypothetical protein H7Y33_11360 [Cytophagales bacterium]|nr:hypothetical protein [Rhizobacter sp.]